MPPNRYRNFAPLFAIAHRVNNRRLAREERRSGEMIQKRLAGLSDPAWTELVEHVPPADDLAEVRQWINPDVLPTPIRNALNNCRCTHQRQQLTLRYLQQGLRSAYIFPCSCPEAKRPLSHHAATTPAEIVRPLSDTVWLNLMSGEYGGEG